MGRNTGKQFTRNSFLVNKTCGVFLLAILGILALVFVNNTIKTAAGVVAVLNSTWIFVGIGAAMFLLGVFLLVRDARWPSDKKWRYVTGFDVCVVGLLIACSAFLLWRLNMVDVIRLLYIVYPCFAVAYLLFSLLQREFFGQAVAIGISMLLFWAVARAGTRTGIIFCAIGLLLCVLLAGAAFLLKKGDGVLSFAGKKLRILDNGNDVAAAFVTAGVLALCFIAGIILTSLWYGGIAVYLIYGLCAYLFILAVYYTVKLM